jgi:hypothetical protein
METKRKQNRLYDTFIFHFIFFALIYLFVIFSVNTKDTGLSIVYVCSGATACMFPQLLSYSTQFFHAPTKVDEILKY